MATAPAFQFYSQDFFVGVITFTNEQVGAYMRLLSYQWTAGGVPNDVEKIARIIGETRPKALKIWNEIACKFLRGRDGLLRNARLEEVRAKQQSYLDLQRVKGRAGGQAKARNRLAAARIRLQPKRSSSSSSSSSVRTYKNAAAPPTPPVEKSERPNVRVLAAMVLRDILPHANGDDGDRIEMAKRRAAQLKLTYDGRSIASAIASASAQRAKGIGS